MAKLGKHFSISGNGSALEIFGAEAIKNERVMTIMLTNTEHGPLSVVDPSDGPYGKIHAFLMRLKDENRLGEVAVLKLSSIAACQLWLQGGITPFLMSEATESDSAVFITMSFSSVSVIARIEDARNVDYDFRLVNLLDEAIKI
jgi:hypothetical protein